MGKKQSDARTYILGLGEELCVATTGALALRRVVLKRKWSRGEMDGGHKRTMIVQQGTERFGRSGAGPERGGDGPGSRGKREGFVGVGGESDECLRFLQGNVTPVGARMLRPGAV